MTRTLRRTAVSIALLVFGTLPSACGGRETATEVDPNGAEEHHDEHGHGSEDEHRDASSPETVSLSQ